MRFATAELPAAASIAWRFSSRTAWNLRWPPMPLSSAGGKSAAVFGCGCVTRYELDVRMRSSCLERICMMIVRTPPRVDSRMHDAKDRAERAGCCAWPTRIAVDDFEMDALCDAAGGPTAFPPAWPRRRGGTGHPGGVVAVQALAGCAQSCSTGSDGGPGVVGVRVIVSTHDRTGVRRFEPAVGSPSRRCGCRGARARLHRR